MLKLLTESRKFPLNLANDNKHDENQYLHLILDIINQGEDVDSRNGKTRFIFGAAMHFSLENNVIPILTTKKQHGKLV